MSTSTPSTPGGILALDLSSHTGWAYGHTADKEPLWGQIDLPTVGGQGMMFAGLQRTLADLITVLEPKHMVTEAPLSLQAMNNRQSAFQQIGLRSIATMEAYYGSLAYHERDVYSVRLRVLGTGRFPEGKVKQTIIAWCQRRGWMVATDNQADACVLWEYYRPLLRT